MYCLGDSTVEFARPRGAKDRRPRKRRASTEAAIAGGSIGGGVVVGGRGGDTVSRQAYKLAVSKTYSELRGRTGNVLPRRIPKNRQASVASGLKRFTEKGLRFGLNRGGNRIPAGQRLALSAIARPGRAGAIAGGLAGSAYVVQRGLRRRK